MTRRGRPPHPDILTPREWEVLELLRQSLSNEQIANRLGITERGAKYHVSEILSKLDVSSREEAAAWQRPVEKRLWRRAVALPLVAKATGLAFTAAAIAGLVILAIGVARTNTSEDGSAAASDTAPFIGDHWHATLDVSICGAKQPLIPEWDASMHTHNDGIIHIHPQEPGDSGSGSALGKFFEYGGGILTENELRMPGSDTTYANGDTCPDGSGGAINVQANGLPIDGYAAYVPQDGDGIVVSFGQIAIKGDVDCDEDVDAVDALRALQHVAGLPVPQEAGCVPIASENGSVFGDVDCDGDVDAVDALTILQFVAALPFTQNEPCTDIGELL